MQLAVTYQQNVLSVTWLLTFIAFMIYANDIIELIIHVFYNEKLLHFLVCIFLVLRVETMLIFSDCLVNVLSFILHCTFYLFSDQMDGVGHVKLYVVPVPRTATEADVSYFFPWSINMSAMLAIS